MQDDVQELKAISFPMAVVRRYGFRQRAYNTHNVDVFLRANRLDNTASSDSLSTAKIVL